MAQGAQNYDCSRIVCLGSSPSFVAGVRDLRTWINQAGAQQSRLRYIRSEIEAVPGLTIMYLLSTFHDGEQAILTSNKAPIALKHPHANSGPNPIRPGLKVCHLFFRVLNGNVLNLIDVGAAGAIQPRWLRVASSLSYTGFEPDSRSRQELLETEQGCDSYRIVQSALADRAGDILLNL